MQCTNNLKQIGIAVHNFHDTKGGVPPAGLGGRSTGTEGESGYSRLGFFPMIYPYVEQTGLYNYILTREFRYTYGPYWWTRPSTSAAAPMNDEIRKQFGSVSMYRCPSRRGGGAMSPPFTGQAASNDAGTSAPYGPQGCYAIVFSFQNNADCVAEGGTANIQWYNWLQRPLGPITSHHGPFRVAAYAITPTANSSADYNSWEPRDSMAWWSDGTSNQFLVGEKHLPPGVFENCSTPDEGKIYDDCSYMVGGASFAASMGRYARSNSTVGSTDMGSGAVALGRPLDARADTKFGSAHPDAVNFLVGDGAVRSIPLTTPAVILAYLGTVDDGNTVRIP